MLLQVELGRESMNDVSRLMEKHSVRIRRGRTEIHRDSLAISMKKSWKIPTSVTEKGLRDCLKLSKH